MLQFSFAAPDFYIFTHIPFSVNNSYFHFETRSSISILPFNNVNFQIKPFVIFQKFSWNSVQPIWVIIMNLIKITYTKLSILYEHFRELDDFLFFIGEKTPKSLTQKQSKIHAKSVKTSVVHLCFVSRILRFNKKRTKKRTFMTCFYYIEGHFKAVYVLM